MSERRPGCACDVLLSQCGMCASIDGPERLTRLTEEQLAKIEREIGDVGVCYSDTYALVREVRERRGADLSLEDTLSLQYVYDLVAELLHDRRPDFRPTIAQRLAWRRTAEANHVLAKLLGKATP